MMKAIVYERYGPPEVLQLQEVEKPIPGENEVLVKVQAASVNAGDWHALRGEPVLQRLETGILKPGNQVLGADVSGLVEAVGPGTTRFQPGDEVYGDLYWCGFGAFAEYVSLPEYALATKPENLTFAEAAAVPQAAFTALHAVRDDGRVQPGDKVLINGASGGVGTFAVQIAKAFGGEVTGVCSTGNLEMARSIGADHVIDYTQHDFTQNGKRYDLIIDIAANYSLADLQQVLTPTGRCVVVGFSSLFHMIKVRFLGPRLSRIGGQTLGMLMPEENRQDLDDMKELIESGKVAPVIDRQYPFEQVPEAISYLEKGHARGKVVIIVGNS
jgi:NADPH:quinone reductase-like Zn-dependent oxidoreductase